MKPHPKLRVACRYIGRGLLFVGVMLIGADQFRALERGTHQTLALGEAWYVASAVSLNAFQAGVQRYLAPALWDSVIAPLLFLPAWVVFIVPGLALTLLCRSRHPVRPWI